MVLDGSISMPNRARVRPSSGGVPSLAPTVMTFRASDPEELATSLAQALDRSIKLELSVIPESHFEVSATRSGSIIDNSVSD